MNDGHTRPAEWQDPAPEFPKDRWLFEAWIVPILCLSGSLAWGALSPDSYPAEQVMTWYVSIMACGLLWGFVLIVAGRWRMVASVASGIGIMLSPTIFITLMNAVMDDEPWRISLTLFLR